MLCLIRAAAAQEPADGPEARGGREPLRYDLRISGDLDDELRALIEESSQLRALAARPPASRAALRRRLDDDLARFAKVLRSQGFYAHEITGRLVEDETPLRVEIEIDPGPPFLLADYVIDYAGAPPQGALPREPEDLGLELGTRARAKPLAEAKAKLLRRLGESGYPFAAVAEERFVADHADYALRGRIVIDPGPLSRFGALEISGLERVDEAYLRRVLAWQPGALFDRRAVEKLRGTLFGTNLFETVGVAPAERPGADGRVPVRVTLSERAPRTLGVGAGYSTDLGPTVSLFWQHRNLLGRQESLRLDGEASFTRQEASAGLRKPNFRRLEQTLLAESTLTREDSDAFKELSARFFTGLERPFGDSWSLSLGPSVEFSRLDDGTGIDRFALVGLEGAATYDSRDDPLNPTEGAHVRAGAAPYLGVIAESTNFLSGEVSGAGYLSLTGDDGIVLAGRARLGSIVGSARDDVPANKRFYAGGGGSVRGYEFRRVGPLDAGNDPIGGRSVLEVGVELRLRLFEDIGLVPFLDGGQVYQGSLPDLDDELLWGAGLGLRYFTPIGPVRMDVAVPLNPRDVDESFQLYFSIGQAF